MTNDLLRSLPSVERLLTRPLAAGLSAELGRERVRNLVRHAVEQVRQEVANGGWAEVSPAEDRLTELVEQKLEASGIRALNPSLRRVVNATGVIIHTNLGRAPLARRAIDAIAEIAANYSNLEYDLDQGQRGQRESHCQELIAHAAGAEAAIVVNNNAAAVLLVLNTLAEGGEVVVSRGELIEIGGSFRIPDVMQKSGCRLVEVGTTNRTRIADYEKAVNERTRLILRVHPSNYKIIGFTERPSVEQISDLAKTRGIPSYEDLGSGCLIDLAPYGVRDEPVVSASVKAGISVVSFSGDKMLGGPQAGIICGSREIIGRIARNPLMRALRVDKLTYAAIEATLRIYDRGAAPAEVPVIRSIAATTEELRTRAQRFVQKIASGGGRVRATLEDGTSVIGGGSAPEIGLPSVLIGVSDGQLSATELEMRLRENCIPIIARTERDRVVLDLRTVAPEEESIIVEALCRATQPVPASAASVDK
jgi:L-seryl-tRNA(Ser) seleniumtransferase